MSVAEGIYEFIIKQGSKCVFPEPWSRLKGYKEFVDLGSDQAVLLANLTAAFAREELIAAGVIVVDEQAVARLAPALTKSPQVVLALRKKPEECPFQLMADNQLVSLRGEACLAAFDDVKLRAMLARTNSDLFVVFSPLELAVFWSLGLPAIPGNDIPALGGPMFNEFFARLGQPRWPTAQPMLGVAPKTESEQMEPIALVLVDWNIISLEPTEVGPALEAREYLLKLRTHLGIDVDDFRLWKPQPPEIERMSFCLKMGLAQDLLAAITESVENSCQPLVCPPESQPSPPLDYGNAVRQWRTGDEDKKDMFQMSQAWDQVRRSLNAELFEPLSQRARATPDPIERNAYYLLAQMSELANSQALLLAAKLNKSTREQGATAPASLPEEAFRQLLALTDRIRAVSQELQPWRKKSKVSISMLPKPKASKSSSNNSASAPKKSPK